MHTRKQVIALATTIFTAFALVLGPIAPALATITPSVVSVRDFGARGDGVTDDTAAFQSAIDAAADGMLSIPAGTYLLGRVDISSPMTVTGAGQASTLLKEKAGNNDVLIHVGNTHDVAFSEFSIDGNGAAQTGEPHGIDFQSSTHCSVFRVTASNCRKSGVQATNGSDYTSVTYCTFSDNENDFEVHSSAHCYGAHNYCVGTTTESMAAYEVSTGSGMSHDIVFEYNTMVHSYAAVNIQRTYNTVARYNTITDCLQAVTIHGGGMTERAFGNSFTDNTITGGTYSTQNGIFIDEGAHDNLISGNTITNWPAGGAPIRVASPNNTISGNTISHAAQAVEIATGANGTTFKQNPITATKDNGVYLGALSGLRFEGNAVADCDAAAVFSAGNVSKSALTGNTFTNNGRNGGSYAVYAVSSAIWSHSVVANNRIQDTQATRTQNGVMLRSGPVAAAGNTITGSSTWPAASSGAAVDIGDPGPDGATRWNCTATGAPGAWSPAAVSTPAPLPDPTPAPTPTPTPTPTPSPVPTPTPVDRAAGPNRYATAVATSRKGFASAEYVVIATGLDYADALAAAPLAGALKAPVLLVPRSYLPAIVRDEIVRLGAHNAVIVGASNVVTNDVARALTSTGLTVERLAGANRYATVAAIARHTVATSGATRADTIFITRGDAFADALAISSVACGQRFPILLVKTTSVPAEAMSALRDLKPAHVFIIGGTSAVSSGVERTLKGLCSDVRRLSGANRYATSAAAASYAIAKGWATAGFVGLATGTNFPDALGGGPACGGKGGVLLLTTPTTLSAETRAFLQKHAAELTRIRLFGGTTVVKPNIEASVRSLCSR